MGGFWQDVSTNYLCYPSVFFCVCFCILEMMCVVFEGRMTMLVKDFILECSETCFYFYNMFDFEDSAFHISVILTGTKTYSVGRSTSCVMQNVSYTVQIDFVHLRI